MLQKPDFLIIGAGVIGLSLAREIKSRFPKSSICIIEKESGIGMHSSGRNSGVLHAGFYYTADSLKAKFTKNGNLELSQYCEENHLKILKTGKLILLKSEKDLKGSDELQNRAKINGIELKKISLEELKSIEPNAKSFSHALWSPTTSSIDPLELINHIMKKLIDQNVDFFFNEPFISFRKNHVFTKNCTFEAGMIINTSGLYSHAIAKAFDVDHNFEILPFKGVYLYKSGENNFLKTHLYPVPDLNNPFLGVHFTITVDQKVKIGPTAMPAFWNEQYEGFRNFQFSEFVQLSLKHLKLSMSAPFNFRELAMEEIKKNYKPYLINQASYMVNQINPSQWKTWGRSGIRAQLIDKTNSQLVQDFKVFKKNNSIHILNAVSPGLTCAFPFAKYLCDQYIES